MAWRGCRTPSRGAWWRVASASRAWSSTAVGLAATGWQPVCHTFERFYLRAAEQVYDALREPGLVVRFVGALAGMLPQGPGPSHELAPEQRHALFPVTTYAPLEPEQVGEAVASMLRQPRSTYLRLLAQPDLGVS